MADYLLEIGMEEIPARFVLSLRDQLAERVEAFLEENRLSYTSIDRFATPRRLAVRVNGLAEQQEAIQEHNRGPALHIAKDDQGAWTKAALGFARGQGIEVDDLLEEDVNGTMYVFADKYVEGLASEEVLKDIDQVIKAMTFPVSMRWHDYDVAYIRPVHWLISLYNSKVLPLSFVGVKAGNQTRGHRFIGKNVQLSHPSEYESALRNEQVIASFEKRQDTISQQVEAIAQENGWHVPQDSDLLEEVTAIVEWPTAFYGQFDENYLQVPSIILKTAMRDHQRYFYVEDTKGELLPYFISVRNGNEEHIENVIKGNLKVLKARLEDALFFYEEDLKLPLETYVAKLEHVNEHYKLGSLADKQVRVKALIEEQFLPHLTGALESEEGQAASQAAEIYKYDLMTLMVDEFSELQGTVGELYGEHYGLSKAIAQAIGSQYMPTQSGGSLPDTQAGALLAAADKLDTLMQYFQAGLIPTGSNDPYALRRQASGLVEIIWDQQWDFDLLAIIEKEMTESSERQQLIEFIQARITQHLQQDGIAHDIIQGATSANHLNVLETIQVATNLQAKRKEAPEAYRQFVEAMSRVLNLGSQVEITGAMNPDLAETESETALIQAIQNLSQEGSIAEQLQQLHDLVPVISDYFENNMVNAEDATIRHNRQVTLANLSQWMLNLVDARALISKF